MVRIELFGVARLRAGRREVAVPATTLGEAIEALAAECPGLVGAVIVGDRPHPAYRVWRDGRESVADPDAPLADGEALWLLAADAGG